MLEYSLSQEELIRYRTNGYLVRPSVFSPAEVKDLAEAVERAATAAAALCSNGKAYTLDNKRFVDVGPMTVQFEYQMGSHVIRVIEPVNQLDHVLTALVDNARLANPMRSILGTDRIGLWTDKLNLKRPGSTEFRWHQDSPYWIHDSKHVDQLPNVMVAIDETSEVSGCLRCIRGSHVRGGLPGTNDGTQLGGFYTNPEYINIDDLVLLPVPAGSLIFFSPHTIHGSGPNQSLASRRALIYTYQPAPSPTLKTGRVRNVL